jgi:hypothetical protein
MKGFGFELRELSAWIAGACAAALVLCACSVDEGVNKTAMRCGSDRSCDDGFKCHRGFCIPDGSGRGGSGGSGGRDAAADEDGGPLDGDGGRNDAGGDAGPPPPVPCDEEGHQRACFSGPPGAQVRGTCRAGLETCENGLYGECIGEILPQPETCNGLDDDCNGVADDAASFGSCTTALPGVCSEGVLVCNAGEGICAILKTPSPEQCNGLDDDCDGEVDNGAVAQASCYPENTDGCTDTDGDGVYTCTGVCRAGTRLCEAGQVQACTGFISPAASEDCTLSGGIADDDDCDGKIDEGCTCDHGDMRSCYSGPAGTQQNGPCRAGTQTCTNDSWGACNGQVLPSPENCANPGVDNDCNGMTDDVPMLGTPCTVPNAVGRCASGTLQCMGSSLTCVGPAPRTETCDGTDDDCDGTVDEGFNLQDNEQNCGRCGMVCTTATPECCAGGCVDPQTNGDHCGTCGTACGHLRTCCGGACVNLQDSPQHCGMCGRACGANQLCCGGQCVDRTNDRCGGCTTRCTALQTCCPGGRCATLCL